MQMPDEAREEEPETAVESYPIIIRSYEPVADLDDRLRRIYAVLSLPPLKSCTRRDLASRVPRRR
jgi:hypothetical protein